MSEIAEGDTIDMLLDLIRDPAEGRTALAAILDQHHERIHQLERQNRQLRRRLQRYEQRPRRHK